MNRLPGNVSSERTAQILIERYGQRAFDFAARQVASLNLADARTSLIEWRMIAMAINQLQQRAMPRVSTAAPDDPNQDDPKNVVVSERLCAKLARLNKEASSSARPCG